MKEHFYQLQTVYYIDYSLEGAITLYYSAQSIFCVDFFVWELNSQKQISESINNANYSYGKIDGRSLLFGKV